MVGIKADAYRRRRKHLGSIDEERGSQSPELKLDVFRNFAFAPDRLEQEEEFVAADARKHIGFAQVKPESLANLDKQGIADRVTVVIIDMLEIIDVEEGERKPAGRAFRPKQGGCVRFDHPPGGQAGQFVEIGATKQFVLDRLLLGEID